MCRMALIISKDKGLNTFEMVMKSAWATHNNDGVGIYWRDLATQKPHLARFKDSKNLAKVPEDYDRMLVHFRKSTKGTGMHPFICRDKPNSNQWILVHNGAVDDDSARKILKGHEFASFIDSEPFVHIWADLKEKDLLKRAKSFTKQCREAGIHGWANLIFYNVITDEYVILVDTAMHIVQSKKRDITIFCSDSLWLDFQTAKKAGIHDDDMPKGAVIYGKGLNFKVKKSVWSVTEPTQNYQTSFQNCQPSYYWPKGAVKNGKSYANQDWGGELPPQPVAYIDDHYFTPSPVPDMDSGEFFCTVCFQTAEFHTRVDLDHEDLADMAETKTKFLKAHIIRTSGNLRPKALPIKAALEKSKNLAKFKLLGNGYITLKVQDGDSCRPQDSADHPATGICQKHWDMGFRAFTHEIDGWYLVKQVAYDSGPSAPKSGIPAKSDEDIEDDGGD